MDDKWQRQAPDRDDEVIRRIAARLQMPVASDPTFDARVMQAVRAEREGSIGLYSRLSAYRGVLVWGSSALLAAAVVLVLVYRGSVTRPDATLRPVATGTPTTAAVPVTAAASLGPQMVRFVFATPTAREVHRVTIAGSFNGWDTSATPLHPDGRGRWVTDVPLTPGRYMYQFVINGRQWVPDPSAPKDAGADFGSRNSVVMVAAGA